MKEQYISFETAKLAKEKGFDLETEKYWCNYYMNFPINKWKILPKEKLSMSFCEFSMPTQSLLQKWLREEHNIHISIYPIKSHWEMDIRDCDMSNDVHVSPNQEYNKHQTYEEALEHGLLEALKLI